MSTIPTLGNSWNVKDATGEMLVWQLPYDKASLVADAFKRFGIIVTVNQADQDFL